MLKIICGILLIILEIPFVFKFRQASYDFARQTAIVVIMLIIPLIVWAIYSLSLFVLRLF